MRRNGQGRTRCDGSTTREPRSRSLAASPGLWLVLGLAIAKAALAAPTPRGTAIVNVATVSADGSAAALSSAPAVVTVRVPTRATLDLLAYAPRSASARPESVVQGSAQSSPEAGAPMRSLPLPRLAGASAPLDLSQPLPLLPAAYFHQGDPVFIRVTDQDQNVDPTVRETVLVIVTNDLTGDSEIVLLTEEAPDSGIFVGYVPTERSAAQVSRPYDGALQVFERSHVVARYFDGFSGDALSAAAAVDLTSIVFDSHTGRPVNGARVTVIDVATGQPASVFSDDGVTSYPSSVISGESVRDGSGRVQAVSDGEFRFPFLHPGSYRYEVKAPAGYAAPSKASSADIAKLGTFVVDTGSRGEEFQVDPEPSRKIDVPVDPGVAALWVQKTASRDVAGIGDAVGYEITVANTDSTFAAAGVRAVDTLPAGFRYRRGSAQVNGVAAAEPTVSPDGRTVTFPVGDLAASATATIRFLATVGAGAQVGTNATNIVSAASTSASTTNVAQATVRIGDDFFSARTFILGRVTSGPCDENDPASGDGVRGARVLLEDGTFAVSDSKGLFHFEGARQGLHVVQLDLESLPEGYEPVACGTNDRFTGRSFSQFVEVKGQTLWRADFHVRAPPPKPVPPPPPPPAPGEATIELSHRIDKLEASFEVSLRGARQPLVGGKVVVELPAFVAYEAGSATLDGTPTADPEVAGQKLTFPLAPMGPDWTAKIVLRGRGSERGAAPGAGATASLLDARGATVVSARTELQLGKEISHRPVKLVIRPHFPTFGTEIGAEDRKQLDEMAKSLQSRMQTARIEVVGYTDSMPIASRSRSVFKDNAALSLGRAKSVGEYLLEALALTPDKVSLSGKGADNPIATNATAAGRRLNRRVEVTAYAADTLEETVLRPSEVKSGPQTYVAQLEAPAKPAAKPVPADGFVSPADGELLAERITAVQVRASSFLAIHLSVDGKEVPAARIGYKSEDRATGKTTYTFVGVEIGERGKHELLLTGTDPFGNERLHQVAKVAVTGAIAQMRFVSAEDNVADGKTPVRARIELLDERGDVIHGAMKLELREGNLQRLKVEGENLTLDDTVGRQIQMDKDGAVEFAPVSASGSYRAVLGAGTSTVEIETWARPQMRDFVLVGLAEGTVGYDVVTGNAEAFKAGGGDEDFYSDGRVAFYAKGQVAGKWLLTAAYDSAKQRQVGTSLFQQIDPQTYFTLYGDASQQGYDAASARKIYVKIERDQFYALFGDYDTGLTVTELSRYSRRMNGFKTELRTRHAEVNAFGARSDQTYARDEIPGDGTSGLYHLSRKSITLNSETVTLVTRDRFRSEVVVESKTMARFTDYSIDYDAGTIFFREPVPSRDFQLNPVTIVVEYENTALVDDYTAGGRAGVKLLDQRVRAGVTAVHEGLGAQQNDLYGADARFQITKDTKVRGEVAVTDSRAAGTDSRIGAAYLAEVAHTSRVFDAKIYFREEQGAFGLGQQPFSEAGTRKWGSEGALRFDERLSLTAQAYRQDTFSTGTQRVFGETRFGYTTREMTGYVGLLDARDRLADGSTHESGQGTAGGKISLLKERLTLGLDYAQSLWGNSSVDFPTRVGAHAEYKLLDSVSLLAADEITFGSVATTNNERIGFRATPWKGGSFTTSVERDLTENDSRVFGNIGLRQSWLLTDAWKVDAGLEHSQTLRQVGFYQPNPAVPTASGAVSEGFTAATAGANYQVKSFVWDSRIEGRTAASGDKWSMVSGLVAERENGWGFSGRGQYLGSRSADGSHTTSADLRFGLVYRPPRTRWILLNRLDFLVDKTTGPAAASDSWRLVDNFLANFRPCERLQASLGYGAKYGRTAAGASVVQGYTDETGLEVRYDITSSWDVGLRASVLHTWTLGELSWSGGPSVGVSPAKNLWLGVGVNVAGYQDADFTASGYQAKGPYLRLRFKFDQQTIREVAAFLNQQ